MDSANDHFDDLEEQIADWTARKPDFPRLLAQAQAERSRQYIGYFLALYQSQEDNPDNGWLDETRYPFMTAFDSDDLAEFASELEEMERGLSDGSCGYDDYQSLIGDWEDSAIALSDKERMQVLTANVNIDDYQDLDRPEVER